MTQKPNQAVGSSSSVVFVFVKRVVMSDCTSVVGMVCL